MNDAITNSSGLEATYDRDRLAQLVRIAIGGRKITEVIDQTGLSRSTISKLLNASSPCQPSYDTLVKLAGGTTDLFWKMIEACNGPLEQHEKLRNLQRLSNSISAAPLSVHSSWSPYAALGAVLRSLEQNGYGTAFGIDYRTEGVFAIDLGTQYPLLVFIPVCAYGRESSESLILARDGLARAFTQWDMSDSVYILLTDSPSIFGLLKELPNPTAQMAVALAAEDGLSFREQHVIPPLFKAYEASEDFPVKLTKDAI